MHKLSISINSCVIFICTLKLLTWLHIQLAKIFAKYPFWTLLKSHICAQTLAPTENHIMFFFFFFLINLLLSLNICTIWDTDQFIQACLKFSSPPNLNFQPEKPKSSNFTLSFLALSSTQIEQKRSKRSWFDPHLDNETGVHILLVDAAYLGDFVQVALFRSLKNWAPFNSATSKSLEYSCPQVYAF